MGYLDFGPIGFVGLSLSSFFRGWGAFISVALFPSLVDGQPLLEELCLPTDPVSTAIWESTFLAMLYLAINILTSSNKPLEIRDAFMAFVGPVVIVGVWFGHIAELPEFNLTNIAGLFLLSRVSVYLSVLDYIPYVTAMSRARDTHRMAERELKRKNMDELERQFYAELAFCTKEANEAIRREPDLANFVNGVIVVLRETGALGYPQAIKATSIMFASLDVRKKPD